MNQLSAALAVLLLTAPLLSGCSGARLSHDEVRKQIAEIGKSSLLPDSIQIQRIVSQSDKEAIAETTVALAFEFKKDKSSDPWRIASVRLGDRNWVGIDELVSAVNEQRRRTTQESMQKLAAAIVAYRQRTGGTPVAKDISSLNDLIHPQYIQDLIQTDSWGRLMSYESAGAGYRLISFGSDGIRGTVDDILLAP